MRPFATEFPVRPVINRAEFIAEIIAWLRGTNYSTVLEEGPGDSLDGESAHLRSRSGEELYFRELNDGKVWVAVGFRHDFPDGQGRLWRTEGVLKQSTTELQYGLLRLRTQCLALKPGARLAIPRKPYIVKMLINDGWGGLDRTLQISDQPVWLSNDVGGMTLARNLTTGEASSYLPVIYISTTNKDAHLLDRDEVEKLAYDLGGVAHVVVERKSRFLTSSAR